MFFLWRRGGLVNGGFGGSMGEWSYPGVDLDEIYPLDGGSGWGGEPLEGVKKVPHQKFHKIFKK